MRMINWRRIATHLTIGLAAATTGHIAIACTTEPPTRPTAIYRSEVTPITCTAQQTTCIGSQTITKGN